MGFKSYFKPGKGDKKPEDGEPQASNHSTTNSEIAPSHPSIDSSLQQQAASNPFGTPAFTPGISRNGSGYFPPGSPGLLASRPGSIYQSQGDISDLKSEVMVSYIAQQQAEKQWTSHGEDEGVVLKKAKGEYACAPASLDNVEGGFRDAVDVLNVKVAMTVNTKVVKLFLASCTSFHVPLSNGLRLQVLPDISYLPRCQKHQYAAFIADRGMLIVWDDSPRSVLRRAEKIERELLEMLWKEEVDADEDEKDKDKGLAVNVTEVESDDEGDVEKGSTSFDDKRPVMLWQAIHSAATLLLSMVAVGAGWRNIAIELFVDGNWIRLAFLVVVPLQLWLALFFFQSLGGAVMQVIGPIKQMRQNSRFYSGVRPKRLNRDRTDLPHVTIQMPVYKEGLGSVIEPTIRSIKAAISTYEMQGGSANIFVNDDGLQLIGEDLARARMDFYDEHNIGWVARPKHDPKADNGFNRRGKFKKASNMNYAMWVSARVEDRLAEVQRDEKWSTEQETLAYREALAQVIADDEGRTWAEGNIRFGDYILIIDSDTRVPEDCFLDAVSEMEQSPRVAIIQYTSGVMNVTDSFFEKGITFFTKLIYTAIKFAVSNGDVSPFIGHNAILRWSAIQAIGYDCKLDGYEKYWSEETVSEDFDMALRLQAFGYYIRFGAYTGDGFKEGVSLTVYDELTRWEKYAYGCSELIFNPFKSWFTKGPITKLFRRFLWSNMPIGSKVTILAYIGTYYALASSWFLSMMNYFIIGWFNGYLDHYYIDSFKIYFAIIIVFTGCGNVALAVLRYRTQEKNFFAALFENLKWVPLLIIFLGGVSLHVCQAILCHMFSINMQWGATAKEAENTTFFEEIPKVIKGFKYTFAFCILMAAAMVAFSQFVPYDWRINLFIAIYPFATVLIGHFLLPIALNPNLMLFKF